MPSLDAIPAVKIAMYCVGKTSRWHWVTAGGSINCGTEAAGLQCVRSVPVSDVEVATQLCNKCRAALEGRKLIRTEAQLKAARDDAKAAEAAAARAEVKAYG